LTALWNLWGKEEDMNCMLLRKNAPSSVKYWYVVKEECTFLSKILQDFGRRQQSALQQKFSWEKVREVGFKWKKCWLNRD
jgi:hypothetical protein